MHGIIIHNDYNFQSHNGEGETLYLFFVEVMNLWYIKWSKGLFTFLS